MGFDGSELKKKKNLESSNKPNKKIILSVFLLIIAVGITSYILGKSITKTEIKLETDNNIHNEIDNQFGWGAISNDAEIKIVRVVKSNEKKEYNNFTHRIPVITLAIKNIGDKKIESFGVNYSFTNTTDKINIGTYAIASGSVESGWETKSLDLHISGDDYFNVKREDKAIDYDIHVQVFVVKKNGKKVFLYETDIVPSDLIDRS